MAFSRVFSDPPSRSIFKKFVVMLLSLLTSLYFMYCLTDRCSTMPTPVRAPEQVMGFIASDFQDWQSLRRKRLLQKIISKPGYDAAKLTSRLDAARNVVGAGVLSGLEAHASALRSDLRLAGSLELASIARVAGFSAKTGSTGKLTQLGEGTKKLPQAIIIGVKKGGTRALLEFLRVHPDIRAVGAEPHFFDRNYDNGLDWYRDLMPKTLEGQITMEKTPSYFVTKEAPARIYAMSRDTKLIVVVRDPSPGPSPTTPRRCPKSPTSPPSRACPSKTGLRV
ncbi:hypothetical protein ANANG_G00034080 [Anguilla anguilla]|uniref:Sulfotransferase n=1 Tax=Anguilla anguilla TaxID=7936 RepID=A0A9D3S705_ANGAN|nr:hypothetical protein ANANG_G00034080 [Anguilla anguilla]